MARQNKLSNENKRKPIKESELNGLCKMKEHYEHIRAEERLNKSSPTKKRVCFLGHMTIDE